MAADWVRLAVSLSAAIVGVVDTAANSICKSI